MNLLNSLNLTKKLKYPVIAVAVVVTALALRGCFHKPEAPVDIDKPLAQDEVLRGVVEHNVIAVKSAKGVQTAYVPQQGSVTVTAKKDGTVQLRVKKAGFSFTPCAGVLVDSRLRGVVAVQFAYFNRFEAIGGVGFPAPVGFVGLAYRLDQLKLDNTSVILTLNNHKDVGVGIVVRL